MHEKGTKPGALSLLTFTMVLACLSRIKLGVWSKIVVHAHIRLWPNLFQISGYATVMCASCFKGLTIFPWPILDPYLSQGSE